MAATLYQKYGGFAAISRIVLAFYDRALDSDQLGGYFEDVDMKRLVDHQTKFIASLLGGPASYSDDRLHQLHSHLGITNKDFDEMCVLLSEAIAEHGFTKEDQDTVMAEVEARRPFIVSRGRA